MSSVLKLSFPLLRRRGLHPCLPACHATNYGAANIRAFHSSPMTWQGSAAEDAASSKTQEQTDPSLMKAAFRELLAEERAKALLGGGQARIDKQHAKGSLTARERLELLFDNDGSFLELDQLKSHRCVDFGMNDASKHFPGDGVVTGYVHHVIRLNFVCVCVCLVILMLSIHLLCVDVFLQTRINQW